MVMEGFHGNRGLVPASPCVRLLVSPCPPRDGRRVRVATRLNGSRWLYSCEAQHPRSSSVHISSIPEKGQVRRSVPTAPCQVQARFPTVKHLASWAGTTPGSDESAGKVKSSKTRPGNPYLQGALGAAAKSCAYSTAPTRRPAEDAAIRIAAASTLSTGICT